MKKFLSKKITVIVAIVICLFSIVALLYVALRPISYNLAYHGERTDEYGHFEATRIYYGDDLMYLKNNNFDLPSYYFYYYKDGYVFDIRVEEREKVKEEIEKINNDLYSAISEDFYASKINAYKMVNVRPDGAETVYICSGAIVLTVVFGLLVPVSGAIIPAYFMLNKKKKQD